MHLMPLIPTLIQKRQLKKGPDVSPIASQRYEKRNIGSIILNTLAVRIKVDRPIIPSNGKRIRRYVFPNPNPFRQRVPIDLEVGNGEVGDLGILTTSTDCFKFPG